MQLAMAAVNEQNRAEGLPDLEMGIGIHTGQVVMGNIGSPERLKYGVVGSQVNLTSRIQSYTTGGQILVSEATRREVGHMLRTGKQMEVRAKGIDQPVLLFEAVGIGGPHKLSLVQTKDALVPLINAISLNYLIVEGSQLNGETLKGSLTRLSLKSAEARLESPAAILSNLEMRLLDYQGRAIPGALYAKVVGMVTGTATDFALRFTSMSPEIEAFFRNILHGFQKKPAAESPSIAIANSSGGGAEPLPVQNSPN
jgi:adenylate cyclase